MRPGLSIRYRLPLLIAVLLIFFFMRRNHNITRSEGVVMLLIVVGGIGFLTLEELYLFQQARRRDRVIAFHDLQGDLAAALAVEDAVDVARVHAYLLAGDLDPERTSDELAGVFADRPAIAAAGDEAQPSPPPCLRPAQPSS